MIPANLGVSDNAIKDFCRRWNIIELHLFGSAIRPDFAPESDIDILVVYDHESHPTLFDEGQMQGELEALFGRPVHFMTKRSVERSTNPIRRKAILESATPVYVQSS
ncbi:MAG: nucleotidyltransferase domain-containing protein [Candidatus Hydrogenedentes bacterium]|nr:nucleotidyltransferase domain-containing protein [Candidatus Hydrogenedentota bacterium]